MGFFTTVTNEIGHYASDKSSAQVIAVKYIYDEQAKDQFDTIVFINERGSLKKCSRLEFDALNLVFSKSSIASALGAAGGSVKSKAKAAASRKNGALGGRPRLNAPKQKSKKALMTLIKDAISDDSGFIGDLTKNDAFYVQDALEKKGYRTKIETDSDKGRIVDSKNWKVVRFNK